MAAVLALVRDESPTPTGADSSAPTDAPSPPPTPAPAALAAPPQVVRYYTLLRTYGQQEHHAKAAYLARALTARQAWAADWPQGWVKPARSASAFRAHARSIDRKGIPGLQVRERSDKGVSRSGLDDQLAAIWALLISAPSASPLSGPPTFFISHAADGWVIVEQETGAVVPPELVAGRLHFVSRADAVREFRYLCPAAADVPASALHRVARQRAATLSMTTKQRRCAEAWIGYPEPSLGWWAVDSSEADLWVWDRVLDPYRPWVTVCVDMLSAVPMAILFTRDAPSNLVTRSLLLQAMYPISETWCAEGFPLGIRSDFGFRTNWMEQLAATAQAELGVELQLQDTTAPETPWANGHAEELIALVQQSLVKRFCARACPAAYWGNQPENRPEWHRNHVHGPRVDRDDEQWRQSLPYPEQLREYTVEWVEELLVRGVEGEDTISKGLRRRLGMSRIQFWRARAAAEVRTLPRELAEPWLMERAEATVQSNGAVHALGETYRHPELLQYARGDRRIQIRYDLADISTVRCYDLRGTHICDAPRTFQIRGAESKSDWGRHKANMRKVSATQREVLETAARLGERTPRDRADIAPISPIAPLSPLAPLRQLPQLPTRLPEIEPLEEPGEWVAGPDGTPMFLPAVAA